METNSLTKPEPLSLDMLFDKDPTLLSDAEMDQIILHFRTGRKTWATEDSSAKKEGRRVKTSKGSKIAKEVDLDIEELLSQDAKLKGGGA